MGKTESVSALLTECQRHVASHTCLIDRDRAASRQTLLTRSIAPVFGREKFKSNRKTATQSRSDGVGINDRYYGG